MKNFFKKPLVMALACVLSVALVAEAARRIGEVIVATLEVVGASTFTGATTHVGAVALDDGAGAAPTLTLQDETNQTLVLAKPDGAAATLTCAQGLTFVGATGITGALDVSTTIKAGSSDLALTAAAGNIVGTAFLTGSGGTSLADPADGALVSTTVTVTGATANDYCLCSSSTFTGLVVGEGLFSYSVSSADTVTVTYQDSLNNAAHADPDGAGTWSCIVIPN